MLDSVERQCYHAGFNREGIGAQGGTATLPVHAAALRRTLGSVGGWPRCPLAWKTPPGSATRLVLEPAKGGAGGRLGNAAMFVPFICSWHFLQRVA